MEICKKIILSIVGFVALSANALTFSMDIFKAIENGNLSRVKEEFVVYKNFDVNNNFFGPLRGRNGQTLLCFACGLFGDKSLEIVKFLLQQESIDINKTNYTGLSPLHIACDNGNIDIVRELINHKNANGENDLDVNKVDGENGTALLRLCQLPKYYIEISREMVLKELLKHKDIDVNKVDKEGNPPLYWCFYNGHEWIANILIERKDIDLKIINLKGESLLGKACDYACRDLGEPWIVKLLLRYGATIDQKVFDVLNNNLGARSFAQIKSYIDLAHEFDNEKNKTRFMRGKELDREIYDLLVKRSISRKETDDIGYMFGSLKKQRVERFVDCVVRTHYVDFQDRDGFDEAENRKRGRESDVVENEVGDEKEKKLGKLEGENGK
jgi:Ankyrin repeat.